MKVYVFLSAVLNSITHIHNAVCCHKFPLWRQINIFCIFKGAICTNLKLKTFEKVTKIVSRMLGYNSFDEPGRPRPVKPLSPSCPELLC